MWIKKIKTLIKWVLTLTFIYYFHDIILNNLHVILTVLIVCVLIYTLVNYKRFSNNLYVQSFWISMSMITIIIWWHWEEWYLNLYWHHTFLNFYYYCYMKFKSLKVFFTKYHLFDVCILQFKHTWEKIKWLVTSATKWFRDLWK